MLHLARFAAGVITGIVAMKLIQSKSTKETLEKAQDKLRDAKASTVQALKNAQTKIRSQSTSNTEEASKPPKNPGARKQAAKSQKAESDKE
jgi:hypothetical protein